MNSTHAQASIGECKIIITDSRLWCCGRNEEPAWFFSARTCHSVEYNRKAYHTNRGMRQVCTVQRTSSAADKSINDILGAMISFKYANK